MAKERGGGGGGSSGVWKCLWFHDGDAVHLSGPLSLARSPTSPMHIDSLQLSPTLSNSRSDVDLQPMSVCERV